MLIRLTVENFLSFNQQIDFDLLVSLVSEEMRHQHHVVTHNLAQKRHLLPTSLIYKANAFGKPN